MSVKGNMVCPACEQFQPKAKLCAHCGVVIAKANSDQRSPTKLQVSQTQSTLRTLKTRLYILSMEWREPPTNEQGLQHLVQQGALTAAETTDAWGRAFAYRLEWKNENSFVREYEIRVHSRAADGLSNTHDDIGMP